MLTPYLFVALVFQNGLKDRNADVQRVNGDDPIDRNLANFRPVITSVHEVLQAV